MIRKYLQIWILNTASLSKVCLCSGDPGSAAPSDNNSGSRLNPQVVDPDSTPVRIRIYSIYTMYINPNLTRLFLKTNPTRGWGLRGPSIEFFF